MTPELTHEDSLLLHIQSIFGSDESLSRLANRAYIMATSRVQDNYSHPESGKYRAYHNLEHTRTVMHAILDMHQNAPEDEELKSEELALLLIAASYHDSVFETGQDPNQNEIESGELAVTELSDYLDNEQKQVVKLIIESTYTTVSEKGLDRSVEVDEKIGGYRVKLMSQILQDADVSTLGTKEFARATKNLAEEWGKINNFRAFLEAQLEILILYNFQTTAGTETFPGVVRNRDLLQLYLKESEVTPEALLKFFEKNWVEQT